MEKNKNLKALNTFGIEAVASEFTELNSVNEAQEFFKENELLR